MTDKKETSIGFVGLGVMGSQIVKRLIDAGYRVHGFNRTRAKVQWLENLGMHWDGSPREAAAQSDVVFSMVSDSNALRAITAGNDGIVAGLQRDMVYVDLSTVDPAVSREVAEQVRGQGATMLDAPVSGSVSAVQSGQLSFMVGGSEAALDRVKPILLDIGSRVTHVGGNGQGCLMKVALNLQVAVQTVAFCESLLLAERGGIDRETASEVILQSAVASPMLRYRAPFMFDPPDEAWFTMRLMKKDLELALNAGRDLEVSVPTTEAAATVYEAGVRLGMGDAEMAAVIDVLPRLQQ